MCGCLRAIAGSCVFLKPIWWQNWCRLIALSQHTCSSLQQDLCGQIFLQWGTPCHWLSGSTSLSDVSSLQVPTVMNVTITYSGVPTKGTYKGISPKRYPRMGYLLLKQLQACSPKTWLAYNQGYILFLHQTTKGALEAQKVHSILQYKLSENTDCCTPGIYQLDGQGNVSQNECCEEGISKKESCRAICKWYSTDDNMRLVLSSVHIRSCIIYLVGYR